MESTKLIYCFNELLLNYMNQGERGQASSFNAIKNGLSVLINISNRNGPLEEMSLIFDRMPEIKAIIEEKTDDFPADILLFHEAQENFERFFEGGLNEPDLLGDDERDFYNLIKEKKSMFKGEIELRKNMAQLIHDQKENF